MACRSDEQVEEEIALSSIYGGDFEVINNKAAGTTWKINISNNERKSCSMILQMHLPNDYPCSGKPAVYEIVSDVFSDYEIKGIGNCLDQLWKENETQCIGYLWAEKCREIIDNKSLEHTIIEEPRKEVILDHDNDDIPTSDGEENPYSGNNALESHGDELKSKSVKVKEQEDSIEIISGDPIVDRKSTFQAHIGQISEESQVDIFMQKLKENRKIGRASHNIMAYRIEGSKPGNILHDCDDDGEHEAASRLMHLLQILDARNMIIVVSRWYGGILLGPDRFKHINNCARELIVKTGFYNQHHNQSKSKHAKGKPKNK